MPITRTTGALIGTDESNGVSIPATSGTAGPIEVDVLGDNGSIGDMTLYLVATVASVPSSGTVDIKVNGRRVSGQNYVRANNEFSLPLTSTTTRTPLGRRPATRYMSAEIRNTTNVAATVSLLYELEKIS